jgi:hypothetical protein
LRLDSLVDAMRLGFVSLLALVGCQRASSGSLAPEDAGASAGRLPVSPLPSTPFAPSEPVVHTDVVGLGALIELPPGVVGVRWMTRRIGDGFLGPSDSFVTAYVELSGEGWAHLLRGEGGAPLALPDAGSVQFSADRTSVLLAPRLIQSVADGPPEGGKRIALIAQSLPATMVESKSTFYVDSVERIGDGLWIELSTR